VVCDPDIVDHANVALETWGLRMIHLPDPDE
jgi:hypothetical protein